MSLLLDALKKAAEEKKRQENAAPTTPAPTSVTPSTAGKGGEEGTQLLTLLQGRNGPQDDESLQDLANTGSQAAQGGFSLSLIDEDDESLDQLGFKEQPSTPATVSFELLDEDTELNDEGAVSDNDTAMAAVAEVPSTTALSGLTLLEEDELEEDAPDEKEGAQLTPERSDSTAAGMSTTDTPLAVQPNRQPATDQTPLQTSSAPEVQPTDENASPASGIEAAVAPGADLVAETDAVDTAAIAAASTAAVARTDAESAAPVTAMHPEHNAPHTNTSAGAIPDASTAEPAKPVAAETAQPVTVERGMPPPQVALGSTADGVMDALRRRRRRRRILVLLLILMLGILAGGWGYVMYETQLQENQQLLSRYDTQRLRAQAQQREREAAAERAAGADQTTAAVAQPLPPAQPATPLEQHQTAVQQDESVSVAAQRAPAQTDSAVAPAQPTPTTELPDVTALVTEVTAEQNARQAEQAAQRIDSDAQWPLPETASVAATAEADAEVIAADSGITIKRRSTTEAARAAEISVRSTDNLVQQGYQAFKQGDYGRAQTLYNQALQQDAFNRDVALGLAALATRARDYEKAAAYYRQLLNFDPVDRAAFEGLIGLPDNGLDPVELESRTRNFLVRYPDSARAQAKLGSVLAQQQRWHEAQQAFFNAWQLDQGNASYALNVAVALDHLRKYRTAASYYTRVLTLAAQPGQTTVINLPQVRQRLAVLSRLEK